uniref:Uncharacterized protein n=1 Tax=Rhizophora mucronata TaxID=61149 RepID=A0A2P2QMB3_RHIMU
MTLIPLSAGSIKRFENLLK